MQNNPETWRGRWTLAENGQVGGHPPYGHRVTAEAVASYWGHLEPHRRYEAVPDVRYPEAWAGIRKIIPGNPGGDVVTEDREEAA